MTWAQLIECFGALLMVTFVIVAITSVLSGKGKRKVPPPLPGTVPPTIGGATGTGNVDSKKCPMCAELIKVDALVCKHCGHRFNEQEVEECRQAIAAAQRERDVAAEREKKRVILEHEKQDNILRQRKASSRRAVAWILIGILALLSMFGFIGAVADAKTSHQMVEGITALVITVLFLSIPLGIPALFLLRSAKRLSREGATREVAVPPEPSLRSPAAPSGALPGSAATLVKDSSVLSREQATDEITFKCPICGQHLAADRNMSRQRVQCPGCHKELVIP